MRIKVTVQRRKKKNIITLAKVDVNRKIIYTLHFCLKDRVAQGFKSNFQKKKKKRAKTDTSIQFSFLINRQCMK